VREALRAGLHVATLWALAVAQPLFDLLGESGEFFTVRDSTRWDIVLFAVGLILVPPAALVLLELLAGAIDRRFGRALHLGLVGGLAGLLVLQVATRAVDGSSAILLPLAALAGLAAGLAYRRFAPVRTFVTVLAPVPLVFLGVFLLGSRAGDLVLASDPEPRRVEIASDVPVVLVVFDELSTVSLLDERDQIDADRYPSFAALAADSTWFRNAVSVDAWSTNAVPAIVTGVYPRHGRLPVLAEHPENLFTLLGSRYRLHVSESLTQLCPRSLCPDAARRSFASRMESLLSDSSLVYAHLALPRDLRERLPSVSGTWGAFLESSHERTRRRLSLLDDFLSGLDGKPRTLSFAHLMFPHLPWEFLPSGRRYEGGHLPGFEGNRWAADSFLVQQAYQRYLLQLGFADRLLGRILERLRSTGLYERALVVVVADHGVSFTPGGRRRAFVESNLEDVAFVPLFVKRPGETESRVVDDPVETVDILPTIAETLGVQVPWKLDGRPLFGSTVRERVLLVGDRGRFTADPAELVARRERSLERQHSLFRRGLYGIGPHPELLGRRQAELAVSEASGAQAELDQADELADVDLEAEVVPARLTGTITGDGAPGRSLAVVLGGRVVAVARSYSLGGEERFSVLVPEDALREGANQVGIFWVRSGSELVRLQ
jgi:Sulfatase